MSAGIEVWDAWETPDGERVFIRYEMLTPHIRGSASARSVVLETYASFPREDNEGTIPRLWSFMRESLNTLGWTSRGNLRVENLASSHLQAAVRQAEQSAAKQRESASLTETEGEIRDQLMNHLSASIAVDRAVEASRNAVILAVAALEAFINEMARDIPTWGDEEDKMPLRSKWLIVPALLSGRDTFNRGRQPFQDFHLLVKTRNRLVHPEPKQKMFEGEAALLAAFLHKPALDVTPEDGRRACTTARRMILAFCRLVEMDAPSWCGYVPSADITDLDTWSTASLLTGVRADPDFPTVSERLQSPTADSDFDTP